MDNGIFVDKLNILLDKLILIINNKEKFCEDLDSCIQDFFFFLVHLE